MTFKKSLVAVEDVDAQPLINLEVLKSGRSEESSMIFAGLNASSILPEVEELAAENRLSSRNAKNRKSIMIRKKMTT